MPDLAFEFTKQKASDWAKIHAQDDYNYGSPQSWWAAALHADVITKSDYEAAKTHYGNLWNYRGD